MGDLEALIGASLLRVTSINFQNIQRRKKVMK